MSKLTAKQEAGRPSSYTKELAEEICLRISKGESLSNICIDDHMPAKSTVTDWGLKDREGFSEQYARAREAREDLIFDEIIDIADDGSNDWMKRNGKEDEECYVLNGEHVQRSRLRIDTRKWQLSKMNPKVYGDKVDVGLTGTVAVTIDDNDKDL